LTHRASAADMHSAAAAIVCRMNGIGFLSFQTIVGRTDFPSLEAYDCQRRTHAAAAATFLASYIEKNFLSISCAEKK
ncbi:MAG TPA: hypothetical protein PLN20_04380, partial [Thermotogota bacterium]|nr:hypothetical protein [Thermotogota bacterium]